MDPYFTPISTIVYIETHVKDEIDCAELARQLGFSLAHLRDIFVRTTGVSLARYILARRIAHAALALAHATDNVADIAVTYGFSSHDAFTRAFRRVTGCTPMDFRVARQPVANVKLCAGIYGPGLPQQKEATITMNTLQHSSTEDGSTILYGVPRVGYGVYGCTPYPICLKACANYLGDALSYEEIMTTSALGFRLTWDVTCWNAGNVDNCFAFDDGVSSYTTGLAALGRTYDMLWRTPETTKEEFIAFIVQHIDAGYPIIARGIIGPPEACIITGYRDYGKTLLGWNFFQDSPEFRGSATVDPSGYFVTDAWWENPDTCALFCVGETTGSKPTLETVMKSAIAVLQGRQDGDYAKGIWAYDAWKKALSMDADFPQNGVLQILAERIMCHGDAMDCLSDGRVQVWKYFDALTKSGHERADELREIVACFHTQACLYQPMFDLLGGWERGYDQMQKLADPAVRAKLCDYIDQLKAADEKALALMEAYIAAK